MPITRRLSTLLLVPALASAQTVISTPAVTLGTTAIVRPGGEFSTGQTFRTPTVDRRLDQLSFWAASDVPATFRAYVFAWDQANLRTIGPALFMSAEQSFEVGTVAQAPRVDVATGGVTLDAGQSFVAFLRATNAGSTDARVTFQFHSDNPYADGRAVLNAIPLTAPNWPVTSWIGSADADLRFAFGFNTATTVIPEPSTYALMVTGLAGLVVVARRRRRA
jgi:hypothetical protein